MTEMRISIASQALAALLPFVDGETNGRVFTLDNAVEQAVAAADKLIERLQKP